MSCKTCKHWQCSDRLRDLTMWSDCNRIISIIEPNLFKYFMLSCDTIPVYWKIPFDPHDIKYWWYNYPFRKYYSIALKKINLISDLRVVKIKEKDIRFDQHGAERIQKININYIQTNKKYNCELFKGINYDKKNMLRKL